jgi:hypothetical protein
VDDAIHGAVGKALAAEVAAAVAASARHLTVVR